ncbi:carbohydrate kinase family protein [Pseudoruegeria sp. SK021]|uniref:carbohydrate kinase family protein n=1 Tax=Pseudoruegeria sp. SK021 TaxID=1933035 RepID=UPI000A215FC6|nr:PfkB family carbohydrate kinase [Pseudoruegeria sp. SK021]OSP54720.1 hypothetical protein BV911_11185 [Pseudoruegeria sp. SK021]
MTRPSVDIVGYASIDDVETADGSRHESIGGGAIYAALSAVRLGVTPRLCIAIGDDFPDAWLDRLSAQGLDVSAVERRAGPSRRTRVVYGQNEARQDSAARSPEWWDRTAALAPPLPPGAETCLLCPLPLHLLPQMRAAAPGLLIADTSEAFAAPGPSALPQFAGIDVFAPSLDEAQLLTGETDEARIIACLTTVAPRLLLKRGVRGLLHWQDGETRICAPPPRTAIDPTGAGDATVGAITAAIALGCSVDAQLRAGAAAGALAVSKTGPDALW